MADRRDILSSVAFWLALLAASGGAFSAGFYYTHSATANVPVKQPQVNAELPTPKPAKPSPTATPTLAPGPIVYSLAPSATPTVLVTATPVSLATETPAATPSDVPPTPVGPAMYRVQVGAFDSRETAQKQVDDLQTQGINAVVVWDGGSYRAQLGAFNDRARALSVADEVNIRGYAVTIRH
jgi:cell division protein FtsN